MPDAASSPGTTGCFVPNVRTPPVVLVCLLFWLCCTLPLHAAEPLVIVVTGIKGDALKNVQEAVVPPAGLVRDGSVDKRWLERFTRQAKNTIQTALEPFGYYNARITVTTEQQGTQHRLLATIVPGEPVQVRATTVSILGAGQKEPALLALAAAFPLQKGAVLLHQSYETAKAALLAQAQELGYLDAEFSRHEIRIAPSATTATIALVLDTGQRFSFGATTIKGAPDYPDRFLRRHLTYKEGQIFSYACLGETQRNFANSERFKTVLVTPDRDNNDDLRVPVTIQLIPGPRISLRPGIGYGTDTGARFTVRYRDLNLFQLGHEWYANLFMAERLQGLVAGYILPDSGDVRNSTTLQLNLQQEDTSTYFSRILALQLDRNQSLGTGRLGTLYLKAQYEDYSVAHQRSTARLLLPGLRLSAQQYDNPTRPERGFSYTVELRGTHQFLGSDTALLQFLAAGKHIQPLPWRLSLRTRAQAGATLLHDPINEIPPSLRFFAGGDQSVRGYSYKSLGPRDSSGNVIGGTQLVTSSVELERAILQDWGVSLFYDAGNSFNSLASLKLLQGTGVGLHYYSSFGALNLSVASPLGVATPSIHLHFTLGFEL